MKSYDYAAVYYCGEVYCNECIPDSADRTLVYPVFADCEAAYPGERCAVCGALHDYMQLLSEDKK